MIIRIKIPEEVAFGHSQVVAALTALALCVFQGAAGSETFTLQTYYPSPAGVYNKLTTTGNTVLSRDSGNVGVGTSAPASKLDVNGTAGATYFQVKGVVAEGGACPSNGLVARDAAGGLFSCQSRVWRSLGEGLGIGQTWQNVIRSAGVTYTNTTSRPIFVSVSAAFNPSGGRLYVDGVMVAFGDGGVSGQLSGIVPPGSIYYVTSPLIQSWVELR